MSELYKKYRPKLLKSVIGQEGAKESLMRHIENNEVPHAILLAGPSGVGKTTIARILKSELHCGDMDFVELNASDFRGVETVREIRRSSTLAPISGECRMWLIDEAHKITNDGQNALLKILEDTPDHIYFILATTDPNKLIKTVRNRCTELHLTALSATEVEKVIRRVIQLERIKIHDDVVDEIVEASEGSARKALVILQQVAPVEGKQQQIETIRQTTVDKDLAIKLTRLLVFGNTNWNEVAAVLNEMGNEDPESVRHLVLSYARKVLLGGKKGISYRAYVVIDIFSRNFFDSKQAGLAAACWEVINAK